jgi:hypothetical protein
MANVMYGEHTYTEQYVVEHDGDLFGPFESRSDATDFALARLDCPWTLITLNVPK